MSRSAAWLRWAGRLVGSLYFAFFMFFLLAHLFVIRGVAKRGCGY